MIIIGTRKYDCPFKLFEKSIVHRENWVLKIICDTHNHELSNSLSDHPYTSQLKAIDHWIVIYD